MRAGIDELMDRIREFGACGSFDEALKGVFGAGYLAGCFK